LDFPSFLLAMGGGYNGKYITLVLYVNNNTTFLIQIGYVYAWKVIQQTDGRNTGVYIIQNTMLGGMAN